MISANRLLKAFTLAGLPASRFGLAESTARSGFCWKVTS